MSADSFNLLALKLLQKNGQPATVTRIDEGAYDPTTGTHVASITQTSVFVYLTSAAENRNENIEGNRVWIYLAGNAVDQAPKINDTITVGSIVWTVTRVYATNQNGIDVLYRMLAARS